jgi:hypothetical protein
VLQDAGCVMVMELFLGTWEFEVVHHGLYQLVSGVGWDALLWGDS